MGICQRVDSGCRFDMADDLSDDAQNRFSECAECRVTSEGARCNLYHELDDKTLYNVRHRMVILRRDI